MALPVASNPKLITVEAFEKMPEFYQRYELLNGKLVRKPMPGTEHARIAKNIVKAYYKFDPDENIGEMMQDLNVRLSLSHSPIPDAAFWTDANRPPDSKGAAPRPDLAIEFWSPGDLDTKKHQEEARDKIERYRAAGVQIIWAINPDNREVEVFYNDAAKSSRKLTVNDVLEEALIPGFRMLVKDLFITR
jgi:Uma2 family endonuclease